MKGFLQKDPPSSLLKLGPKHCPKISTKMVAFAHTKTAPTDYENRYASELMLLQRGKILHFLDLNCMVRKDDCTSFDLRVPVKNYGKAAYVNFQTIEFLEYPYDQSLCPVYTLTRYIKSQRNLGCVLCCFLLA